MHGIECEAYIELLKERNSSLKCLHLENAFALLHSKKGNEYLTLCQNLEELVISGGHYTYISVATGIN